jgi:hypothetical protein
MSPYALGVDLGTTYSAAAIARGQNVNVLQLGTESAAVPSVVLIRDDGDVLVGDAAERRSASEPARSAREFKRRLGDPVPLIVGDQPYTVEQLMGYQLRDLVRRATEQEGEAPAVVVLTHPANYTEFKLDKLRAAAEHAGLERARVILLAEPEAAAISYTRDQKVNVGDVIAVYDFGGGTFDAALVRNTAAGFELIGVPEGMERLGGIDFDQAVLAHVDNSVGGLVTGADRSDPQTLPAQARLRVDCRRAKEALSVDGDTTIPVALPGLQTEIRLTRSEFESMVRPRIVQTVAALERTIASAGLTTADITRVLLVGGTSRMPIVAEMVRSATGRPVGLDTHPKLAIATGAALAGAATVDAPPATAAATWQTPTRVAPPVPSAARASKNRKPLVIAAAVLAAGIIGAVAVVALNGGSDDESVPATSDVVTDSSEQPDSSNPSQPDTTVPDTTSPDTAPATTPDDPRPTVNAVATLTAPAIGLADSSGDLIAVGADSSVVRIAADGAITPLGTVNGTPGGLAIAPDGDVVVSTPDGVQRVADGTMLLDGSTVGLGTSPGPLAFDGAGNLYVADNDNGRVIRQSVDGALSLVAGNGGTPDSAPVNGAAVEVALGKVTGLAIDGLGRLLIADSATASVRAVTADGSITTVVGGGAARVEPIVGPVSSTPTDLALGTITGLSVDGAGGIAITDERSGVVLTIDRTGTVAVAIARQSAIVAPIDGVPAGESTVGVFGPVVFEPSGAVVFADGAAIRRIADV